MTALITRRYVRRIGLQRLRDKADNMLMLSKLLDRVSEVRKLAVLHELQNAVYETTEYYRSIDDEDEETRLAIEKVRRRLKNRYDAMLGQFRHTRDNTDEFVRVMGILGRNIDSGLGKQER